MNGSIFLTSFAAMYCAGSKSRTSPAMRVGNVLASKCVTIPMPLRPALMLLHAVATSLPTGDTKPNPVTTTRLFIRLFSMRPLREINYRAPHFQITPKRKLRPRAQLSVQTESKRPAARAADGASGLDVRLDVVNRLLHGGDLFGFFVGNLGLELFLESHDQLNGIERIGAQIVHEGSVRGDILFLDAKLFDDDLLDALFDAAHVG